MSVNKKQTNKTPKHKTPAVSSGYPSLSFFRPLAHSHKLDENNSILSVTCGCLSWSGNV